MKKINIIILLVTAFILQGCGSFEAKRVSTDESDELAMKITDKWVTRDTEIVVSQVLKQLDTHKGFQRYLRKLGRTPKIFISEVQNDTSEAYFPIDDINDELLNEFSSTGDFILIDESAREKLLKEIVYQNDGMVEASQVKTVGKAAGADLLVFGAIRMKPKSRDGKTIKEYTVNLRMTDIEQGIEVLRTRVRVQKYSDQKSTGW